jgi:DNA-binding NtrC family response regulator
MADSKILIIDDEHLTRSSLKGRLEKGGYRVIAADTAKEGVEHFAQGVDLVFLAHRLSDSDGLTLLRAFQQRDADVPVIWMTPFAPSEVGLEAIREGAYHSMIKPFKLDEAMILVKKALETTRLKRELRALRAEQSQAFSVESMIGESPVMRELKARLSNADPRSSEPVLLIGESGVGKDLAARVVHYNSERRTQPFLYLNCSAHTEPVLDGELFGLERPNPDLRPGDAKPKAAILTHEGLLERADGGTLFLDEINALPFPLQTKLLRFLESRAAIRAGGSAEFNSNVRLILACDHQLDEEVRTGRFREDLYAKLRPAALLIPPLRERQGDIGILVQYYVGVFNREFRKRVQGVTPEALRRLEAHPWRGNLRELRNAVERALLITDREMLSPLEFDLRPTGAPGEGAQRVMTLPPDGVNFEELERDLVIQALERTGGNQTRAAVLLGMKRDQIRYRVEKFGLVRTGRRRPSSVSGVGVGSVGSVPASVGSAVAVGSGPAGQPALSPSQVAGASGAGELSRPAQSGMLNGLGARAV